MLSPLNWRELEILIEKIQIEAQDLFVDRIVIPERPQFTEGYLKGEWAIRLIGKKKEATLLFSIRPRHPYLTYSVGKGPKAAPQGTHSAFDLSLSKYLKGRRLLSIEAVKRERVAIFWFSDGEKSQSRLGLVLTLIPSTPEALLILDTKILARSRTIRDESKKIDIYTPPNGSNAPEAPPVREELLTNLSHFSHAIHASLQEEAFLTRSQAAQKELRHLFKQTQDRFRQSQKAKTEAEKEPDWQARADLLKANLGNPDATLLSQGRVLDYSTGEEVSLTLDPHLTLQEQVEKFYQNAKRKQRRISEAQTRMELFSEKLSKIEEALQKKFESKDWESLQKLEILAGIFHSPTPTAPTSGKKSTTAWHGKSFLSKEGLVIWVGRNKDENLELTFKHARGNDLWMHVRGRPGAHIVIPIQPGKSVPLETLLDAAHLTIHYSGGSNWGKTEIDYTFKKYVKRIKDSSEASYTHNKTLLVTPDPARLQRLLGQQ